MEAEDRYMLTMLEVYRRARGWSQAALADFLGNGFTASAISMLEAQRLKPSQRQEQRLREVFGDQAEAILKPVDPAQVAAPIGEPS
jgi:transcriptional regulator with XRE-family HTH domain